MAASVSPAISGAAAERDSVIRYSTSRVSGKRAGSKMGSSACCGGVTQAMISALLRSFAATAVEQHELPAREDPDRLAFELHAILLGADTKFVLDDPAVLDLARQVVHQRLELDNGSK